MRAAAAAGAIQLCGTLRWSRMAFFTDSAWDSFFVPDGGEARGLSFPVICCSQVLPFSRLEAPSSSLLLSLCEGANQRPHGMVVRPPGDERYESAVAAGRWCRIRNPTLEIASSSGKVHGPPPHGPLWGYFRDHGDLLACVEVPSRFAFPIYNSQLSQKVFTLSLNSSLIPQLGSSYLSLRSAIITKYNGSNFGASA